MSDAIDYLIKDLFWLPVLLDEKERAAPGFRRPLLFLLLGSLVLVVSAVALSTAIAPYHTSGINAVPRDVLPTASERPASPNAFVPVAPEVRLTTAPTVAEPKMPAVLAPSSLPPPIHPDAADFFLVSGDGACTATALATDAGCWAATSGGAGGAGIPGETDRAIMDSNSGTGGTQDAALSVANFIGDGSVGTGAFTGTWDNGGFSTEASGSCKLGGTFTVTGPSETDCGSFDSSAATFNFGSGVLVLTGNPGTLKTVPGGGFAERLNDVTISTGAVIELKNNIGINGITVFQPGGKLSNPAASYVWAAEGAPSGTNPLVLYPPVAEDFCGGPNISLAFFATYSNSYNVPGAIYICKVFLENSNGGVTTVTALGDITAASYFLVIPCCAATTVKLNMGIHNLTTHDLVQIGGGSLDGTTDAGALTFTSGRLWASGLTFFVYNQVSYIQWGSSLNHLIQGGYDDYSHSASWDKGTGHMSFFSVGPTSFHINGAGSNLPSGAAEFKDIDIGANAAGDWRLIHDFKISGTLSMTTAVAFFTWNGGTSYSLNASTILLRAQAALDTHNSTITVSSWDVQNGGYYFTCRQAATPNNCISTATVHFVSNGSIYGGGQITYGDFWNVAFEAGSNISYLFTWFAGNRIWLNGTLRLTAPDYTPGQTRGFGTNSEACSTDCVSIAGSANLVASGIFVHRNSGDAGRTIGIATGTYNVLVIQVKNGDVIHQLGNVSTVCNVCASYVDGEMLIATSVIPAATEYHTQNYSLSVTGVFFIGDDEGQDVDFYAGSSTITTGRAMNFRGNADFYAQTAVINSGSFGTTLPALSTLSFYVVSLPTTTGHAVVHGDSAVFHVNGDLRLFEPGDVIDIASSRWVIGANYGAFASQMVFYAGAQLLMAPGSTLNIPAGFKIDATNGYLGWNGTANSIVRLNASGAWTLTLNALSLYVHYVAVNGSLSNRVVHNCVGGIDNGGNTQWYFPSNLTCSVETLPATAYPSSSVASLNGVLHFMPPANSFVTTAIVYGDSPTNLTSTTGDFHLIIAGSFSAYIHPAAGAVVYFQARAFDQNGTLFSEGEILSFTMSIPTPLPDAFNLFVLLGFIMLLVMMVAAAWLFKQRRDGGL